MKLTYRGVQYQEKNSNFSTPAIVVEKKEIVYRGNSLKPRISPKFPWWQYIKQLFGKSESRSLDPISLWYDRKREFIEECWRLNDIEKLDLAWNLTLQMEMAQALKSKQKIKLKYRGVTYYR